MESNYFTKLSTIDVGEKIEKRKIGNKELSYLSWSWAVTELTKQYPDFKYKIHRYENSLPYMYDENTGYMVSTEITIDENTKEMWLPVMDGSNKAMKSKPYSYKVKKWNSNEYEEKWVSQATMFDINKTLMRCLVKNIGMFGLGLYIYAGEDLPEAEEEEPKLKTNPDGTTDRKSFQENVADPVFAEDFKRACTDSYNKISCGIYDAKSIEELESMKSKSEDNIYKKDWQRLKKYKNDDYEELDHVFEEQQKQFTGTFLNDK